MEDIKDIKLLLFDIDIDCLEIMIEDDAHSDQNLKALNDELKKLKADRALYIQSK